MKSDYLEIKERIEEYYKDLLSESMSEEDANRYFVNSIDNVIEALLEYAKENNYWWEERNIKMAYYQMRTSVLVVPFDEFKKYYKELMDEEYDVAEMSNTNVRKNILKRAEENYKRKAKMR